MGRVLAVSPNSLLNFTTGVPVAPGRATRCPPLTVSAEGKGVNVARVLADHGHAVTVCAFAGGPSGWWFGQLLATRGLDLRLVDTAARLRCGFLAGSGAGAPTELLENGSSVTPDEVRNLLAAVTETLAEVDLAVIAGSIPDASSCADLLHDIAGLCARANVPCWIDSYGPAMDRVLVGGHPLALVKPNRDELASSDAWSAAQEIHCTDGDGPVMVDGARGRWRVIPPRIAQVNPVGSGDSYLAGLAHARLTDRPFPDQLRYAAAAGAANAAVLPAAEVDPTVATELASRVVVEELNAHEL